MVNNRPHRMLLAIVVRFSWAFCNVNACCSRLPSLGTLRRRKLTQSRKLESAKASPMLPGGSQTGCVSAVYCCVSAELKYYCGNPSLQRPPNSKEKTKLDIIYESGSYEKQKCMPVLFSGFGSYKIQPGTISSDAKLTTNFCQPSHPKMQHPSDVPNLWM